MTLKLLRLCSLVLVAFLSVQATAQINLNAPVPVDPNVRIGKLPNGLTYYIRKNPLPEKKVELRLVVNAGSILEDKDQRGLAHFMEHMNFNGSKHFPKNELVDFLQKAGVKFGADLNAYTSFDETVYMLPLSTDDPELVAKGFLVLEDWAFNNLLDKTEIDKERGVVLEESRMTKGAQERMLRQYFPRLFNGSLYADRLPIGTDSVLQYFKYETLERFYRQWYRPNLMAVVVVGDIDPDEMEKKIKSHFSAYKNPANAKPRPASIPIRERANPEVMVVTDDENPNTVLQVINYIRPSRPVKTWAQYREEIIDDLVNSIINQRLSELTTKENPPFAYGFAGKQNFIRGYDAYASFAVLSDNDPREAIDALVAENERARKFGFLKSEIERAKAELLNNTERAYNEREKARSNTIVNAYVQHFLQGKPIPGIENRYKFIQQILPNITEAEINAAARKIPPTDKAFTLLLAPGAKKDQLPDNAALLNHMIAASKQTVTPYTEKAISAALMEKEPAAGKIVKETRNDKLGTVNLTLGNGVTVTVKSTDFKNDQILMDAWRWGGFHRYPLDMLPNAKNAASNVVEMGVKDLSPTDLEKFLSGKTASATPYINDHEEGIQGNSSVKDFETFLQLVNLYFTQPRKDESLFRSMITKQKGMLQFMKNMPEIFYQDTLMKVVYNNSPWVSLYPTEQELNSIDLDRSFAIYQEIFGNASGMHFTFVGNIDLETAKPLLEKYLGSLPSSPMKPMYKDNQVRPLKGVVEANFKKGKEQKSFISYLWTGETEYNRDEIMALNALVEVLNIKVIEVLREEIGGMYSGGLYASVDKRPYINYSIYASIPTGPENVDKLSNALMELIRNAQEKGVEQKDLDKVKENWRKKYRDNMKENSYWLNILSKSFIDQTDPEYYLEYEKKVEALTLADLQQAARKFLNMQNYIRAVLYPEDANISEGVKKTF